MHVTCPSCHEPFPIVAGFLEADGKRLAALLAEMEPVLGRAVLAYLRLFKPAKQGLRTTRAVKLVAELDAMVREGSVTRDERTVAVLRKDLEDDNLGIYAPMAQDAGFSAQQLPDEIVSALKNNAFAATCYDGQYFYDTDHPVTNAAGVVTSVSNLGSAMLDSSTRATAEASYGAARTAIMTMTDNQGRPLALVPNVLEVPPALEAVARIICEAPKLDDNGPNPFKDTAAVLVNPRLTSATAWFLHCTNRPVKPFIYLQRIVTNARHFIGKLFRVGMCALKNGLDG